jgi:diguanylate cyclase (GGDEF)-like protein
MELGSSGDAAVPQRILVVDDSPESADLLRGWYRGQPFEIVDATSGEEALRLVAEAPPDLILLDLRMPGMDGLTVARRLKEDPRSAGIPIILLTACRDTDAKVEAFNIGADDYVTKPFEVEEVAARVRTALLRSDHMSDLRKRALMDDKTGLYGFREFQRRLHEEWQRAARYATMLSLVFLDLDDFKRVNDTLGHQVGDEVLIQFAALVAGGARANDVAARYGGEEFAVILPHTDGAMGRRVAERIVRAVRDTIFLEDRWPTRITVSAGVATYVPGGPIDSVDALVRAADMALYRAKDAGRDRVAQA